MNTETRTPRTGRPKLPPAERKSERIAVYVTPGMAREIERRGGSAYIERTLRRHVPPR